MSVVASHAGGTEALEKIPSRPRLEDADAVNDRVFHWGLSHGVSALAIAGCFWYGVSFAVVTPNWGWRTWALSTSLQVGISATIFWAAVRLRRRSGFTGSDLRRGDKGQRQAARRIARIFGSVVLLQTALIGSAVWWCIRSGAKDMIWPAIGLIVSAHFAPLARLFHVRAYYATALAGIVISLAALAGVTDIHRNAWFGPGMAAVMWLSGWYIIRNAGRITATALHR